MTLQETIKGDLKRSMKAKDETKTSTLRVLIGEFQRQSKKELNDSEVLSIIRKLIKAESEMLERSGSTESDFLTELEGYMPKQASEQEIREWIEAHVDFSQYNNKMQAMKPIMAHFSGAVDGNTVKRILLDM